MRALPFTVAFALAAFGVPDAYAYCVRNALSLAVHAEVVALAGARPPKVFSESVAAGREFCCNPKNLDCNPDRIPDAGNAWPRIGRKSRPPHCDQGPTTTGR